MVQNGAKTTNATDLAVAKFLPPEFNALHGKSAAEVFLDTLPPSCLALTCDLVGQYFGFNGKCWEPLTDEYICLMLLKHPVVVNQGKKNPIGIVKKIKQELDWRCPDKHFGQTLDATSPSIVNCLNTEVWINDDGMIEQKPHNAKSGQLSCLPFAYDPQATCPTLEAALQGIFAASSNPADMIRHFFELVGYCLQNRRHIPMWVFLIGKGRNGKSKLLQTIERLLGQSSVLNMSLSELQLDRFNMIALRDKKAFIDDDMKSNMKLDDGLLKRISEAKVLTTRGAYGKGHVQFESQVVPWLASNHYPTSDDNTEGFNRRLQVIPFDHVFTQSEDDPTLFPKIWATEMPGFLNEAIKGYQRICQRGSLLSPADCLKAAKTFMINSNPLQEFLDDACEVTGSGWVTLKLFREHMNLWAKDQGHKISVPGNKLKSSLENMGYEVSKIQGMNSVKGISFKVITIA